MPRLDLDPGESSEGAHSMPPMGLSRFRHAAPQVELWLPISHQSPHVLDPELKARSPDPLKGP